MQRPGTEPIRSQIQLSKPIREITEIVRIQREQTEQLFTNCFHSATQNELKYEHT